jgi:two-component sensor histidine kinase
MHDRTPAALPFVVKPVSYHALCAREKPFDSSAARRQNLRAVTGKDLPLDAVVKRSAMAPAARITLAIVCAYTAAALALLPVAKFAGPEIPGINPAFTVGLFITQVTVSFLLLVRFREQRDVALFVLACAYLYSGLMTIPYLLTFPEALLTDRAIIGGPQSTSWIFLPWIVGFALLTLIAVVLAAGAERRVDAANLGRLTVIGIAAIAAAVAAFIVNALWLVEFYPPLIAGIGFTVWGTMPGYVAIAILLCSIALIFVRVRRHTGLFLWLALALTAMACANLLSNFGGARYTVGWTIGRLSWLASGCVLFLYFIGQFVRQQRFLGHTRDILEQRVAERTADLTRTVAQRDLLLREVHHRVKNNFQVLNSLINFMSAHANDATRETLEHLHRRVYSLGLVYRQLMQSDSLAAFDVRPFLDELCTSLTEWPESGAGRLRVTAQADPLTADLAFAGPLGLLITELVTHAVRRGFPQGKLGKVSIALQRRASGEAVLTVSDNSISASSVETDGELRITLALVKQLNGALETSHGDGTTVTVVLRHPKIHALADQAARRD